MTDHKIASHEDWQAAREALLAREKEHTRHGDELARKRRELPRLLVEKEYRLDTGCPVNSSMVDGFDGLVPHLHARDLTLMLVFARAAGEASGLWASSANSDFNFDLGASSTEEQIRQQMPRIEGREVDLAEALQGLPPIARQNAAACGTDVLSYICESPMVSAFALEDGAVYQTYTSTWRGLEFIMGYYPILDRTEGTRRGRRRLADLDSPPRSVCGE
jgi:predicted dithiol-disulfide oxidoreductase (DUF899 family)